MSSLYGEIHDYSFCMNKIHSNRHESGFYYCGQRIPRNKEICSECAKNQEKK